MPAPRTPRRFTSGERRSALITPTASIGPSEDAHVDPEQTDVLRGEGMLGPLGTAPLSCSASDAEQASAAEGRTALAPLRDIVHRLFSSISRGEEPRQEGISRHLIRDYPRGSRTAVSCHTAEGSLQA